MTKETVAPPRIAAAKPPLESGSIERAPDRGSLAQRESVADLRSHRAPGEKLKRGAVPLPNLILIDGGKGQLNAACAELAVSMTLAVTRNVTEHLTLDVNDG